MLLCDVRDVGTEIDIATDDVVADLDCRVPVVLQRGDTVSTAKSPPLSPPLTYHVTSLKLALVKGLCATR